MKKLNYQIQQICNRNRDGSRATQSNRERILNQAATQLRKNGFKHVDKPHQLKPRHMNSLIKTWKQQGLAIGTIKNRVAEFRWLAQKIDNPGLVAKSNDFYDIENRTYTDNIDRSLEFRQEQIDAIRDEHVQVSAMLQRDFGLRREEAIKFQPDYADRGNHIVLKSSWCKGGREREIPVLSDQQRETLKRAHRVAQKGALIPADKSYKQQKNRFEKHMAEVGLARSHGARHRYAQERYNDLTGKECPCKGGLSKADLSAEERKIDTEARQTITEELGHGRINITNRYLGS